jgi:hypothetical protein
MTILAALELKNNKAERGKIKRLNAKFGGPVRIGRRGEQPFVDQAELVAWWEGLAERVRHRCQKGEDAKHTLRSQHLFGRSGTVLPEISGRVRERRHGTPPPDPSPT